MLGVPLPALGTMEHNSQNLPSNNEKELSDSNNICSSRRVTEYSASRHCAMLDFSLIQCYCLDFVQESDEPARR